MTDRNLKHTVDTNLLSSSCMSVQLVTEHTPQKTKILLCKQDALWNGVCWCPKLKNNLQKIWNLNKFCRVGCVNTINCQVWSWEFVTYCFIHMCVHTSNLRPLQWKRTINVRSTQVENKAWFCIATRSLICTFTPGQRNLAVHAINSTKNDDRFERNGVKSSYREPCWKSTRQVRRVVHMFPCWRWKF